MAILSDPDRVSVWTLLMMALSLARESIALSKPDLREAVDAADTWANSNAASYNSALPLEARTNLTAAQKARLLALVILKRHEKGS